MALSRAALEAEESSLSIFSLRSFGYRRVAGGRPTRLPLPSARCELRPGAFSQDAI